MSSALSLSDGENQMDINGVDSMSTLRIELEPKHNTSTS